MLAGAPIQQPLENTPGWASTAGMVDMSVEIPALSSYGVAAIALLVLLTGGLLLKNRWPKTV